MTKLVDIGFVKIHGEPHGEMEVFKIKYGQCKIDTYEKVGATGVKLPSAILVNKSILFDNSLQAPSICRHNGKLFISWAGTGNNRINIMSSSNGINFTNKVTLAETCFGSPCIKSHNGKLYLAWTGTDAAHRLNILSSLNGIAFSNKSTFGDTSIDGPSLESYNGNLFISWTGTDAAHRLNVAQII
ncbi:MAG: hypothetical protein IPO92_12200 [Saprospiraceae bacterium]|nr:hypothetical protein [Saprospiraceae bacterium]